MNNTDVYNYIVKVSNDPSELDTYIERVWKFTGGVIMLGNTCVLLLSVLCQKSGLKPINNGMLGSHIQQLKKVKRDQLGLTSSKLSSLVVDLNEFNKYLNLAKHSILAGNDNLVKDDNKDILVQDMTSKQLLLLTEPEQNRILSLGSSLSAALSKLLNHIV